MSNVPYNILGDAEPESAKACCAGDFAGKIQESDQLSRKDAVALKTEFSLLGLSFLAKIPLLVIFWVSVEQGASPGDDDDEFQIGYVGLIAISTAFVLTLAYNFFFDRISFFGTATTYASKFRAWNLIAALIHLVVAFVMLGSIAGIENQRTATVLIRYDVWVSGDTNAITEGREEIAVNSFGFIVPVFSIISGLQHLVTARIYSNARLAQMGGSWFPRTLDYSISATLIFIVNLFVFTKFIGIAELLFAAAAYILIMFVGWAAELVWYVVEERIGQMIVLTLYLAGMVAFVLSWIPVFWRLDVSIKKSNDAGANVPDLVYIFVLWIFFSFLFFPGVVGRKLLN